MVKAPIKRKQKQKIKQKVKVSQNVKVVIGDVKRKQVRKSSGQKSGASAKPPVVLNISNPQPNNMFMEYFKKQLQNQEPVKAKTLTEQVLLKEKQEIEASRAGLLGKLVQEPDDVARDVKRQGDALQDRLRLTEVERKLQEDEMVKSFKKAPKEPKSSLLIRQPQRTPIHEFYRMVSNPQSQTPLTPQQEGEEEILKRELEEQSNRLQRQMSNPYEALEDEETRAEFPATAAATSAGGGAGAGKEEEEWTIKPQKKQRGRPKGSKNKKKKE